MPIRTLILLLACLPALPRAQCPPADSVIRRIAALRAGGQPGAVQLKELLPLESRVQRCPYSNDSTHEILLRRIALISMAEGDFTGAARYLNKACDIIIAANGTPRVNSRHIITYYYFLSNAYDSLHNTTEKRRAQELCIDWSLRLHAPSDISALRCLYDRVERMFDLGDYNRCIEDALLCERLANEYAAGVTGADAIAGRGIAESSHGWCVEALLRMREFDTAEQLLTNKATQYKKNGLTGYLAFINTELAELQLHKGNDRGALDYFNLALRHYKAAGKEFEYKQTLKSIGEELWLGNRHDASKALLCYREALRHNRPAAQRTRLDSIEDASLWNNIANIYAQRDQFDSAFACFREAFNQVQPGSDENGILRVSEDDIRTYKKLHYLASLLIDKADAWRRKYTITRDRRAVTEAARIYRVADQLLGRISTVQRDLHSRLFWRADTRRLYEHAIDLCFLKGDAAADAFYFFERSRAALLNGQLAEQWMQGGEAIARQAAVRRRLLGLGRELQATPTGSARHAAVSTALYSARQELDSLERQIKAHNPLYYQGFLDSSHITIADVRNTLLADHSALLEIFYGDSAVYTLLTTAGSSWLDRIDKTAYDNAVDTYLGYLGNAALLNRDFSGYTRVAHTLFTLLFNKHYLPPGRMIVSPDGRPFPLEALITDGAGSNGPDALETPGGPGDGSEGPPYMLYRYTISYTYSARYLQNNFAAGRAAPRGDFLGVAPVCYRGTRLAALEGSDASLDHIGGYFGSALNLVATEATRARFRDAFSSYRFIQLYTHSSDSSDNKEPVIYFADSSLYLSDLIPDSRPAAQLIVLSACETGNGRFYRGEGVFSFNRGFAAMGIPCSVSNLWSIDNTSTYRITELFYQYLADGLPVDVALQKAKLAFIHDSPTRERRLPYYWASSIVIGKANAVDFPRAVHWWWWAVGGLVVVLALVGYRLFFAGKRSN